MLFDCINEQFIRIYFRGQFLMYIILISLMQSSQAKVTPLRTVIETVMNSLSKSQVQQFYTLLQWIFDEYVNIYSSTHGSMIIPIANSHSHSWTNFTMIVHEKMKITCIFGPDQIENIINSLMSLCRESKEEILAIFEESLAYVQISWMEIKEDQQQDASKGEVKRVRNSSYIKFDEQSRVLKKSNQQISIERKEIKEGCDQNPLFEKEEEVNDNELEGNSQTHSFLHEEQKKKVEITPQPHLLDSSGKTFSSIQKNKSNGEEENETEDFNIADSVESEQGGDSKTHDHSNNL